MQPVVSTNEGLSPVAKYGMTFDHSAAGSAYTASFNTIICPIMEGLEYGLNFQGSGGNLVLGGTCEAGDNGVLCSADCFGTVIIDMDCEVNSTSDFLLYGSQCKLINCDSLYYTLITGDYNQIEGGKYGQITLNAGADHNVIKDLRFDYTNDGSTITDNGGYTRIVNCCDLQSGAFYAPVPSAITVGASPYDYTNTTGTAQQISVYGGTVSAIVIIRGGSTFNTGQTTGIFTINPDDVIRTTYSSTPTMNKLQL
jgi:hypothetical protein